MSSAIAHFPKGPPSNVEAEAALIGAMLMENGIARIAAEILTPDDFYEPTHGRLFARANELIAQGLKVTPVTLNPHFAHDEGLMALGGQRYLARLTGDGQGLLAPRDLAEQIRELAIRRRRLAWLEAEKARCIDLAAPIIEISPPSGLAGGGRELPCLDFTALAEIEPEPKQFIIPRIAPAGEVTLFTGAGAVGKSLMAQQFATALAAGRLALGLDLIQAPAIYLTCEDDAEQLHWRQAKICRSLGVSMADLAGQLHVTSLRGQLDNSLATFDASGAMTPAPLYSRIAAMMRSTRARLVCLDNVAHLFPGNENDRGQVTAFVNLLNRLAGETGAAILLLAHPNKAGDSYSGSTAWLNAVRSQATMERPQDAEDDPDLRTITLGKPNYVQAGEALRFRWREWAFVRDEDLPRDVSAELNLVIAANGENAAFLRCLDVRNDQERPVSESQASRTYAPKEFAAMPEAKGYKKQHLEAAMERLFRTGEIEVGVVCRTGRKDRVGIRRKCADGALSGCADLRADPAPTGCADPALTPRRRAPSHTPSTNVLYGAGPVGSPPPVQVGEGDDDEPSR
ncbi:hypothetical protein NRB_02040 [Novosphingobium sp. 11B]